MPIPIIAAGIKKVHQKSSEFLLKFELSKLVVVFIVFSFSRHLSGELAEGMRIVDSTPTMRSLYTRSSKVRIVASSCVNRNSVSIKCFVIRKSSVAIHDAKRSEKVATAKY